MPFHIMKTKFKNNTSELALVIVSAAVEPAAWKGFPANKFQWSH